MHFSAVNPNLTTKPIGIEKDPRKVSKVGFKKLKVFRKMKKMKKMKNDAPAQPPDSIVGTNLVNAVTGNTRTYIMATLANGEKKYVGEITQGQSEKHQALMEQIQAELHQQKLGFALDDVKVWARQRRLALLGLPWIMTRVGAPPPNKKHIHKIAYIHRKHKLFPRYCGPPKAPCQTKNDACRQNTTIGV